MKKNENFIVRKANGSEEYFSFQKLHNSLINANASIDEAKSIVNELKVKIHEGISTNKIHSMAFRMLKRQSKRNASCYYLKKGIMELGPTGYPFENFITFLFKELGYDSERGQILNGKCVSHEIDVIAKKGSEIMLMECKYKNVQGIAVDVKVPLYINSRFQDILDNNFIQKPFQNFKGWIVTNSRFTEDAIVFSNCKQISLLSWDYPVNNSLKELIDQHRIYPLTCLTSITTNEKKWLLSKKLVLVKELDENEKILTQAGISSKRIKKVLTEIKQLIA